MATDKPRYSITVDHELLQKIEDFRYVNKISTRAEATVELVRRALTEPSKPETLSPDLLQLVDHAKRLTPAQLDLLIKLIEQLK